MHPDASWCILMRPGAAVMHPGAAVMHPDAS